MNNLYIFPTDTVYALACKFNDKDSYDEIVRIKERDPLKLLPVLAANVSDLKDVVELSEVENHFINTFMPGPLTIIVKVKENVELIRCGNKFSTIAFRIPSNEDAVKLLRENGPMFATSLNKSGEPPETDKDKILEKYSDTVSNIITDDSPENFVPSTIISIDKHFTIHREGKIKKEVLIYEYNKINLK